MERQNFSGVPLTEEQIANRKYLFEKLKKDNRILQFLNKYELDENFLYNNIQTFKDWLTQMDLKDRCEGSNHCYVTNGYYQDLYYDGLLQKVWVPCSHQKQFLQNQKFLKNYKMKDFPSSSDNLTVSSILAKDESLEYMNVVGEIISFLDKPEGPGFYIYGDVGVGKTYLVTALTNELAKMGKTIAFVHTPSLINDFKNKISNRFGSIDNELYILKNVDILVLDDIGSEGVSDWTRDDILLSILNHRMEANKTCFYTSNLSVDELYSYYAVNNRREVNKLSSQRLLERIKMTSREVHLKGKNRRVYL